MKITVEESLDMFVGISTKYFLGVRESQATYDCMHTNDRKYVKNSYIVFGNSNGNMIIFDSLCDPLDGIENLEHHYTS